MKSSHRVIMTPVIVFTGIVFTGIIFALYSSLVHASGFFTPAHGVRIQGRGGAGVLSAIDINAMWYNPALLAGLGQFHLTVDLTLLDQDVTFERAPRTLENGTQLRYPKVDNIASPLTVPQLGVASNLGTKRFVFALGSWAPNGATARYPEDGPQRYTIVDTEGSFALAIGFSVGWRATDWLWIGAGFQNHFVRIRLVNVITAWPGFTGDAESEDYDLLFEGIVSSTWSPSGNFGVRISLPSHWDIGLSAQLPVQVSDNEAKIKQRLPSGVLFDPASIRGNQVQASFDQPWMARAGIRYHQPRWDIELNAVMEFWNIFDEISINSTQVNVQNVPGIGSIQAGSLSIPRQYQDTLSIRLGSDFKVIPDTLDVRAGIFGEQSAIPTKTLSVLQVDTDKIGLSIGATWHATQSLSVDFAYSHLFYQEITVGDSVVRQINPTDANNTIVVGNGTYKMSIKLVGLGIRLDL
jgi:long-chain fatty acid transport protein